MCMCVHTPVQADIPHILTCTYPTHSHAHPTHTLTCAHTHSHIQLHSHISWGGAVWRRTSSVDGAKAHGASSCASSPSLLAEARPMEFWELTSMIQIWYFLCWLLNSLLGFTGTAGLSTLGHLGITSKTASQARRHHKQDGSTWNLRVTSLWNRGW